MLYELNSDNAAEHIKKTFPKRFAELMNDTYSSDPRYVPTSDVKKKAQENRLLYCDLYPDRVIEIKNQHDGRLRDSYFNNPTKKFNRWRNGLEFPNTSELFQLSCIFHCSIDYLVGRSNVKNENVVTAADELMVKYDTANIIKEYPERYKKLLEMLVCDGALYDILKIMAQYNEKPTSIFMDMITDDLSRPLQLRDDQISEMRTFAAAGLISNILKKVNRKMQDEITPSYPEPLNNYKSLEKAQNSEKITIYVSDDDIVFE